MVPPPEPASGGGEADRSHVAALPRHRLDCMFVAADADLERVRSQLAAGQYDAARDVLATLLQEDPRNGVAHLLMAEVQIAVGDFAGAEGSERLASGAPEIRPAALNRLASVLALDPQRTREAWAAADEAVRLAPSEWRYRDVLGAALAAVGDFDQAIRQSETAVRLAPDDPGEKAAALRGLAQVLSGAPGQQVRAEEVARQAVAVRPGPTEYQMLAATQLGRGRNVDAVQSSLVALRSDPSAALPASTIGLALLAMVNRTLRLLWFGTIAVVGLAFALPAAFGVVLATGPAIIARLGGALGLTMVALVGTWSLRPILRPSVLRPLWQVVRRWAWVWVALVAVGLAVLSYLVALVLGIPDWLPMPFLLMIIGGSVSGSLGSRMRVPPPADLIAHSLRH